MKIQNTNKIALSKTKLLLVAVILLIAAMGAGTYWYLNVKSSNTPTTKSPEIKPTNTVDYSPAKESDKLQDSAKDELAKPTAEGEDASPSATTPLGITITSAGLDGNVVRVRTLVDGATSGTCTLTASLAGQTSIIRSAPVAAQASYALCQGFNLSDTEFPVAGTWNIEIRVETSNHTATAKTNLEIKKS